MWAKVIIQIICYFIMFLLGHYQGWKLGRKRRPSAKNIATFTNEELSMLDDALLNEIEQRTKEAMKQRRARSEGLKVNEKEGLSRSGGIESQDATEGSLFEEFEGGGDDRN